MFMKAAEKVYFCFSGKDRPGKFTGYQAFSGYCHYRIYRPGNLLDHADETGKHNTKEITGAAFFAR